MKKLCILIVFLCSVNSTFSQLNYYENGRKALYWGISLGFNFSNFNVDRQPISPMNDTIVSVSSLFKPSYNVGLIGNWQFNKYFDLRFVPTMVFSEREIEFRNRESLKTYQDKSIYLTFPLLVRYKSEPINDFRLFLLGGVKYDYNISPQVRTPFNQEFIPQIKNNLHAEYGIGIQYFFQYFIFSPQIKFSHSLFNTLDSDQSDYNKSAIKSLYPRTITFSLNFEG